MLNSLLFIGLFSFYGCSEEDIDYQQLFKNILIEEKGIVKSGTSLDDYTSELLLADPYILCDDDGYYAYGTGVNCSYGLEVFYSNDLYTWENCGYVISKDIVDIEGAFWAPEVYKVGNKYLMYFANAGNGYNTYVALSDSPKGPFSEAKIIVTNAIDPTIFTDDNGDSYIYYSGFLNGEQKIYCRKLSDDLTSVVGDETLCVSPNIPWEGSIVEGPSVFKYNNHLFLAYSGQVYTSPSYSIGLAELNQTGGSYEKMMEPILSANGIWYGTGHCSLFYDNNSDLRIVFHAHNSIDNVHPRRTYIGRFYCDNGKIVIGNKFVIPHISNK